jgi:hypothetical protein
MNGRYVESAEVKKTIEILKKKPASMRICKFVVIPKVIPQPCEHDYQGWGCPVYENLRKSLVSIPIKEGEEEKEV